MQLSNIEFVKPELRLTSEVLVVGSSRSLLHHYGGQIDSFETVIRFNRAPTVGFEEHVGTKTELRILNNHVFENVRLGKEFTNQPQKFVNRFNKRGNRVYLFDYQQITKLKNITEFESEANMSVGAVTVALLINSGIKVKIIGFDLNQMKTSHYWEERPEQMSSAHDQSYEKYWLKNLLLNKKIKTL